MAKETVSPIQRVRHSLTWANQYDIELGWCVGDLIFTSGQAGVDDDGNLIEDFEAQARRMVENLRALLEAAGSSLDGVIRQNIYIKDAANTQEWGRIRRDYYKPPFPTSVAMVIPDLFYDIEIDVIAVRGANRSADGA